VGINHLGDWGTQFGKMIVAYKLWGDHDVIDQGGVDELVKIYVRYHQEVEGNPSLDDEARAWFKRIEDGAAEALELFDWFKKITLAEVEEVYSTLNIHFDSYAGESFYNDKMGRVVDELKEKNLLKLDQGAQIVDLADYKMPPCIILRSDGATRYATRDIAAALYRKDTYDFAKCLYVVAYQQDLHFRQWFKVVELMGYDWAKDLIHVSFGMVSGTDGAFSTRKGNMVKLRDVLTAACDKTYDIIREKSPDLEDKETIAKQVGIGALIWNSLYNGRIKDVVFDWDAVLNFDGETGPYAQYTHARACSVLRKADYVPADVDYSQLTDSEAAAVIAALGAFPDAVLDAMEKNEPYLVTRAIIAICAAFNKFYYEQRIMADDASVRQARLALTDATRKVIAIGLNLIGIAAPERM
jgi:arginyl-tRNA synthetase